MICCYLDCSCRIKFVIANGNRWPQTFYHIVCFFCALLKISARPQTCGSLLSSFYQYSLISAPKGPGYDWLRIPTSIRSLFFCGIQVFCWAVPSLPKCLSLCPGRKHEDSYPELHTEWPQNSACRGLFPVLVYVLGTWVLSFPYIMLLWLCVSLLQFRYKILHTWSGFYGCCKSGTRFTYGKTLWLKKEMCQQQTCHM